MCYGRIEQSDDHGVAAVLQTLSAESVRRLSVTFRIVRWLEFRETTRDLRPFHFINLSGWADCIVEIPGHVGFRLPLGVAQGTLP